MKILGLSLQNFTSHAQTRLRFPTAGVVAITGENGSGKSSILEGIAWGGWGKTLRGTKPWNTRAEKPGCKVLLLTDTVEVMRKRDANTTVIWSQVDAEEDEPTYETPTKAQTALERVVGGFDLWRRSHVLSSADAAHFSRATDGERKRLIESFLGIDRFDPALKACRIDLNKAVANLRDTKHAIELSKQKLDAASTRLQDAKRSIATLGDAPEVPPPMDDTERKRLRSLLSDAKHEVAVLREATRGLDANAAEWNVKARQALALLERLRHATCPTCTQAITEEHRQALRKEAEDAKAQAAAAQEAGHSAAGNAQEAMREAEGEVEALQKKLTLADQAAATYQVAAQAVQRHEAQRAQLQTAREQADAAMHAETDKLEEFAEKLQHAIDETAELTACERVLGLKGVRANILGTSLQGIEMVANTWLARLRYHGLSVRLSPYTETGAGTSDSISLEVDGLPHDLGYDAMSGGERRRIDIGLLLALGEVAAAARGMQPGTLCFDEVFDCLDDDGTDAVAELLGELAQERLVLVVTHSVALLGKLRAAKRLHVTHGEAAWL